MEYSKQHDTYILRIDRGEEIAQTISSFAKKENIQTASIAAIGAAENITIGWYDVARKEYEWKTLEGAWEITSILGNITHVDAAPHVHIHGTFGGRDFSTMSGHVKEAWVSGACEVFIRPIDTVISRKEDAATGLKLLDFI